MTLRAFILAILAIALPACSTVGDLIQPSKGSAALATGLKQYDDGEYPEAARNIQAAIDLGLSDREAAKAHKNLAFIHCASARERACREEFSKALSIDPTLELTAAEAGHPVWGPIFASLKGSPTPFKVALQQYDSGDYAESAKSFQGAINQGLGDKELASAHKHLAFIHCSANREKPCRDEFRKALAVDPALELTPAEAGHPVWGPIFASLKGGPAPFKLAMQQYEAGEYAESAKSFQGAINEGLSDKQLANAHKHLAFIHCSANRQRQCRDEFKKALSADPNLELDPAEAGHPVWGPIFKAVKAGG
ncbi:MAG: TssQ family T6SS-associated lipoprotein [Betaproteobacteria bacterium]|nr:TssQ family T6SS-associated lipoprotein [Betaproteobacteria bacterium]